MQYQFVLHLLLYMFTSFLHLLIKVGQIHLSNHPNFQTWIESGIISYFLSMVIRGSQNRWARWYIITHLAVYNWYISGMFPANWVIVYHRSDLLREPGNSIDSYISFATGSLKKRLPQEFCRCIGSDGLKDPRWSKSIALKINNWLVVSTPLKNMSQIGNFPRIGVKLKNVWNHHLV